MEEDGGCVCGRGPGGACAKRRFGPTGQAAPINPQNIAIAIFLLFNIVYPRFCAIGWVSYSTRRVCPAVFMIPSLSSR